jgi:hypothetical protein
MLLEVHAGRRSGIGRTGLEDKEAFAVAAVRAYWRRTKRA